MIKLGEIFETVQYCKLNIKKKLSNFKNKMISGGDSS
jgi:hypothetical protein